LVLTLEIVFGRSVRFGEGQHRWGLSGMGNFFLRTRWMWGLHKGCFACYLARCSEWKSCKILWSQEMLSFYQVHFIPEGVQVRILTSDLYPVLFIDCCRCTQFDHIVQKIETLDSIYGAPYWHSSGIGICLSRHTKYTHPQYLHLTIPCFQLRLSVDAPWYIPIIDTYAHAACTIFKLSDANPTPMMIAPKSKSQIMSSSIKN
jgi:hypothetical protein